MKLIVLFLAVLISPFISNAGTHGIINESKAVVLVQGSDSDAKKLFDAMNVPAVEVSGRLTKTFKIDYNTGEQIFSMVCNWATLANNGSCTLQFFPWRYHPVDVQINLEQRYVLLETTDKYRAEGIANNFNLPEDGYIFTSEDSNLRIWVQRNHLGQFTRFAVKYDN